VIQCSIDIALDERGCGLPVLFAVLLLIARLTFNHIGESSRNAQRIFRCSILHR
jgi:hypothetical protein